jgi:hypothetical protein
MKARLKQFTRMYGAHPLHLLALLTCFAFVGYVINTVGVHELWSGHTWWQTILVWFVGAIVLHDLLLFPLYTVAHHSLGAGWRAVKGRLPATHARVASINYIRTPLLASALLFAVYVPGIIEQGGSTYRRATGLTQQPFLGRYLLLIAALFAISAVAYAIRTWRTIREERTASMAQQSVQSSSLLEGENE